MAVVRGRSACSRGGGAERRPSWCSSTSSSMTWGGRRTGEKGLGVLGDEKPTVSALQPGTLWEEEEEEEEEST